MSRPRDTTEDAHGHAGRRDVGPYHAPHHVRTRTPRAAHAHRAPHTHAMRAPGMRAPGRARRPRRAAPKGRRRGRTRTRGPPRTSAPTTHAPHHAEHMVGRDVLGAPRPRRRRRGRPRPRGPPRTSAPTTHRAMSAHARRAPHTHTARRTRTPCAHLACAHLVGRDVLGAPRPRRRRRGRTRPRGPPRTSAPTTHRTMPNTW